MYFEAISTDLQYLETIFLPLSEYVSIIFLITPYELEYVFYTMTLHNSLMNLASMRLKFTEFILLNNR